jgi:hypothetical protein
MLMLCSLNALLLPQSRALAQTHAQAKGISDVDVLGGGGGGDGSGNGEDMVVVDVLGGGGAGNGSRVEKVSVVDCMASSQVGVGAAVVDVAVLFDAMYR